MSFLRYLIEISFILLASRQASGQCDFCQPGNSVACHSETVFSLCIEGRPTLSYIKCPENTHCTADEYICYKKTETTPSCSRTDISSNSTPVTDEDNVDNRTATNSSSITNDITSLPISVSIETITTPKSKPTARDANTLCKEEMITEESSPFHKNELDTTCKTYVFCSEDGNEITGSVQSCPGNLWYSELDEFCVNIKPDDCSD